MWTVLHGIVTSLGQLYLTQQPQLAHEQLQEEQEATVMTSQQVLVRSSLEQGPPGNVPGQ